MQYPLDFKVGIVGPRHVGKTSLIAAILTESRLALNSSATALNALGLTKHKLHSHQERLLSAIDAGVFRPEAIRPNMASTRFDLEVVCDGQALRWGVLDFPGEWMSERSRAAENQQDWQDCLEWIRQSPVLIIPIDATYLMEADRQNEEQQRGIYTALELTEVQEVAAEWARARVAAKMPGLLVFAPLKCESYFADNGGTRDDASLLQAEVLRKYRYVLHEVQMAFAHCAQLLSVEYHPIDTFGCVELVDGQCQQAEGGRYRMEFRGKYAVRPSGNYSPRGASGLLGSLAMHLFKVRTQEQGFRRLLRIVTGRQSALERALRRLGEPSQGRRFQRIGG